MKDSVQRRHSIGGRFPFALPESSGNRRMSLPTMAVNVAASPCPPSHAKRPLAVTPRLPAIANSAAMLPTPSLWMGVLDRIIDWFQGSPRRHHLEKLCELMCGEGRSTPQQDAESTALSTCHDRVHQVQAFYALKALAKPAYQDRFEMTMACAQDGLQYRLKIDGTDFDYKGSAGSPLQSCIDLNRIAASAGFGNADGIKLQGRLLGQQIERELRSARHGLTELALTTAIRDLQEDIDHESARLLGSEDPLEAFGRQLAAVGRYELGLPISVELVLKEAGETEKGTMIKYVAALDIHVDYRDKDNKTRHKRSVALYESSGAPNLLGLLKSSFHISVRNERSAQLKRWMDREDLIEMNLQTATSCDATRKFLKDNLSNPAFSSKKLLSVWEDEKGHRLIVRFRGNKLIVLCNRSSTNGEFRGDALRKALKSPFDSLSDLLSRDFLTEKDGRLRVSMSKLFSAVKAMKHLLSPEERRSFVDDVSAVPLVERPVRAPTLMWDVLEPEFTAFLAEPTPLSDRQRG